MFSSQFPDLINFSFSFLHLLGLLALHNQCLYNLTESRFVALNPKKYKIVHIAVMGLFCCLTFLKHVLPVLPLFKAPFTSIIVSDFYFIT